MDDRDFFDHLFQQFARTTGAEDTFWMPEVSEEFPGLYNISSVDERQKKHPVASYLVEVDADFITAIHGCMPDLVRRLHDALDEADHADSNRDEREQEVFRLALENQELRQQIEAFRSKAADVLWKTERPM
jgi:hypothetical protein